MATDDDGRAIFEVWKTYEDVAMHFNDLLIKLRVQALAGVAALAVLASIVGNVKTYSFQGTWIVASACFMGLMFIWVAIWLLDRLYYNRLLIGSVAAIAELEELSKSSQSVKELNLSAHIERAVSGKSARPKLWGVTAFYSIVFAILFIGFIITTLIAANYPSKDELRASESTPGTAAPRAPSGAERGPTWSPVRPSR